MPSLTIHGEELIDRVPGTNRIGTVVSVPESWESSQLKVVRTGHETHAFKVNGQEAVERVVGEPSGDLHVSVPESWESTFVKVIRSGEPLPLRTADEHADMPSTSDDMIATDEDTDLPGSVEVIQTQIVDAIKRLNEENEHSNGVPVGDVMVEVTSDVIPREACETALTRLKKKGRVYSPSENRVKLT